MMEEEWKSRGYVPDSDDEDDDEIQKFIRGDENGSELEAQNSTYNIQQAVPCQTSLDDTSIVIKPQITQPLRKPDYAGGATEISGGNELPKPGVLHGTEAWHEAGEQRENPEIFEASRESEAYHLDQDVRECQEPRPEKQSGIAVVIQPNRTEINGIPFQESFDNQSMTGQSKEPVLADVDDTPSSVQRNQSTVNEHSTRNDPHARTVSTFLNDSTRPSSSIPTLEIGAMDENPRKRNLRQRNLAQLHPYTSELEQYRRSLKARGLQPVNIAESQVESQMQDPMSLASQDEASDSDTYYSSQKSDERSVHRRQEHIATDLLASPPVRSREYPDDGSFDELPDLDSLPQRSSPSVERHRAKRRRLTRPSLRKVQSPSTSMTGNCDKDVGLVGPLGVEDLALPVSPAHTDEVTSMSRHHKPVFKHPHGVRPQLPPTPLPSSDLADHGEAGTARPSAVNLSDSEDDLIFRERPPVTQVSSDFSSEDDLSDTIARRQARLTRGVLPASFAKIHMVLQAPHGKARKAADQQRSHRSSTPQRGIARRRGSVSRRNPPSRAPSPIPIVLSDDDSTTSTSSPRRRTMDSPLQKVVRHRDASAGFDIFTDAEEFDEIDTMAPKITRQVRSGYGNRKKRSSAPMFRPMTQGSSRLKARRKHQSRISDHVRGQRSRPPKAFRPPKLSILDATRDIEAQDTLPDFIRVANRTARKRPDQGRHSPTSKFLRLHTTEQTESIEQTLHGWRSRSDPQLLNPITTIAKDRRPLQERDTNSQPISRPNSKQTALPAPLTSSRPQKTTRLHRKPSTLGRQASLDQIIERLVARTQKASHHHPDGANPQDTSSGRPPPQLQASMDDRHQTRPAELEAAQQRNSNRVLSMDFGQDFMHQRKADYHSGVTDPTMAYLLGRGGSACMASNNISGRAVLPPSFNSMKPPKRVRKRTPKRLRVPSPCAQQISETANPGGAQLVDSIQDIDPGNPDNHIVGLKPYGPHYTITFDIQGFPSGTYFHETTYIGGGSLLNDLNISNINLDQSKTTMFVEFQGDSWRWGAWDQVVSSQLDRLVQGIITKIRLPFDEDSNHREEALSLIRKMNKYLSRNLSFADPVDRAIFSQQHNARVVDIIEEVRSIASSSLRPAEIDEWINVSSCLSITAYLGKEIATHELVPQSVQEESKSLLDSCAKATLRMILRFQPKELKSCIENVQHMEDCAYSLRPSTAALECLVIIRHLLTHSSQSLGAFWSAINDILLPNHVSTMTDVSALERQWEHVFVLLPFLDFDARGLIRLNQRKEETYDNWELIKRLVDTLLTEYSGMRRLRPSTFNIYSRALFGRCLHLIKFWSWYRCESMIGLLFDFFAQRGLAPLNNEHAHGSPAYLEQLDHPLSLNFDQNDQCFHVLLKMIALGLHRMCQVYPSRKIRDIVWRLMPNHGRVFRKEEEILASDMAALRNHHDLLCTLYRASPPEARPRIRVIENLVDIETSHREACHINVRSWGNLLRYQLSTSEPSSALLPFAQWCRNIFQSTMKQYRSARIEAESEARDAAKRGAFTVHTHVLESTILQNQRQSEAVLLDIINRLQLAVETTDDLEAIRILILGDLVDVFDVVCKSHNDGLRRPQLGKSAKQILELLRICTVKVLGVHGKTTSTAKDDSQDYGDWAGIVEDIEDEGLVSAPITAPSLSHELHDSFNGPLKKLLSDILASEQPVDDEFLQMIIEVWALIARLSVKVGIRTWDEYLGLYGTDSWTSFRDTERTRQYVCLYLANLIQLDNEVFPRNRLVILRHFIGSVVERQSQLKYQYQLTNALCNLALPEPLLHNAPFAKSNGKNCDEITALNFSSRRLSLLSTILSNMRLSVDTYEVGDYSGLISLKSDYKELLKHMMSVMKHNYQQAGSNVNSEGAYVQFAHNVVELLQQHTVFICPIDRFFTDANTFPLPAADPDYVVGQLKSYALRLHDAKAPKQLAMFIQSISERAVTDGQQDHLAKQLHSAMSTVVHFEVVEKTPLSTFMIQSVVPCYIEAALTSPCGASLAEPLLRSLQPVVKQYIHVVDGTDTEQLREVDSLLSILLEAFAFSLKSPNLGADMDTPRLRTVTVIFSALVEALPLYDYLIRLQGPTCAVIEHLGQITNAASDLLSHLLEDTNTGFPGILQADERSPRIRTALQSFISRELDLALTKSWSHHGGHLYVTRGTYRQQVITDLGSLDEERGGAIAALDTFLTARENLSVPPYDYDPHEP